MAEKSSVFDMIGPVMIGPSSSHTAGVVRIGLSAHKMVGGVPEEVEIIFYNSFALTYQGHGSDKAILAGLLGLNTDDKGIKDAINLAKKQGLKYSIKSIANDSTLHPNSVKLKIKKGKITTEILGESKGGGLINIAEVNGFKADFSTNLYTIIITANDVKGSIAFIADILAHDDCNIATMSVSRRGKFDLACLVIEMDSELRPTTLEYLKSLNWVKELTYLPQI